MKVEIVFSGERIHHFSDGTKICIRPDSTIAWGEYSYRHRCQFNGRELTKEIAQAQYDAIQIAEWRPHERWMYPFSKVPLQK